MRARVHGTRTRTCAVPPGRTRVALRPLFAHGSQGRAMCIMHLQLSLESNTRANTRGSRCGSRVLYSSFPLSRSAASRRFVDVSWYVHPLLRQSGCKLWTGEQMTQSDPRLCHVTMPRIYSWYTQASEERTSPSRNETRAFHWNETAREWTFLPILWITDSILVRSCRESSCKYFGFLARITNNRWLNTIFMQFTFRCIGNFYERKKSPAINLGNRTVYNRQLFAW